ncbi:MAG: hypothetical protein B6D55_02400 [Candidatus Omnitrophica bacterium 4484_70.2]|nr:MAG: hypothetical protein B6D55_02400 [Candidatus Omnitrophica bacterium 4484_70.2]
MERLIFEKQSKYAKIQLFEDAEDKHLTLSLDGFVQFEEGENEKAYHEALTTPVIAYIENIKKVAILGGGDGLAARNLLQVRPDLDITLVDIDEEVVNLCRTHPRIKEINQGSLDKVKVIIADAKKWVLETKDKFSAVILDFPDPTSKELEALYTVSFYRDVNNILNEEGIISIQAGNNWIKTFSNAFKVFRDVRLLNYSIYNSFGHIVYGKNGRIGCKNYTIEEVLSRSG